MRKNNTTTIVPRGTINKGTNKMKTITINLTEEQEKLLLQRVVKRGWRLSDKHHTYLQRDKKGYKNASEFTKARVADAKRIEAIRDREDLIADGFIDQIKKQLED